MIRIADTDQIRRVGLGSVVRIDAVELVAAAIRTGMANFARQTAAVLMERESLNVTTIPSLVRFAIQVVLTLRWNIVASVSEVGHLHQRVALSARAGPGGSFAIIKLAPSAQPVPLRSRAVPAVDRETGNSYRNARRVIVWALFLGDGFRLGVNVIKMSVGWIRCRV